MWLALVHSRRYLIFDGEEYNPTGDPTPLATLAARQILENYKDHERWKEERRERDREGIPPGDAYDSDGNAADAHSHDALHKQVCGRMGVWVSRRGVWTWGVCGGVGGGGGGAWVCTGVRWGAGWVCGCVSCVGV